MYLVSLYFDEQTNEKVLKFMKSVAVKCGNNYMFDKNIPPHMTIASVSEGNENEIISVLDSVIKNWKQGQIDFVAIGSFKPHVLFLSPILNEYLNELSVLVNEALRMNGCQPGNSMYLPYQWLPHTTIARTLNEEQMITAFRVLQANFEPFSGTVIKVGLAKNNSHRDIKIWEL